MKHFYTEEELIQYEKIGQVLAAIFTSIEEDLQPGLNLLALQSKVNQILSSKNLQSAFAFKGFPATIITAVNDQVNNIVPVDRELLVGDLLNLNIGIKSGRLFAYQGWTYAIGQDEYPTNAMTAIGALKEAVNISGPGVPIARISEAIEAKLKQGHLYPCDVFMGHGFGPEFHAAPAIAMSPDSQEKSKLQPGQVISIVVIGMEHGAGVVHLEDGWGCKTRAGGKSVFYSQMLAIHQDRVVPLIPLRAR